MAIDSVASLGASSSLTGSRQTIAENFDTFLQLLTTQLKNQNPLDPLDTNQFTQQLVQFTSVEQQLKTNTFLEALIQSNQTAASSQAVGFIGKEVSASSTMTEMRNGSASWLYNASQQASDATITIKDPSGNVVYTEKRALEAGPGRFDWNGVSATGQKLPDGPYQIQIDASDVAGANIPVTTQMTGIVEGVDFSGQEPFLMVGGSRIALASVSAVSTPSATDTAQQ